MIKRTKKGSVYTDLVLSMLELYGLLTDHGIRITKPCGQSPARWQVLGAIPDEPLAVSQIARRMGLTRQSVQRVANILNNEGLVEYVINPDHQRSPKVRITPKGRAILNKINDRQASWANEIGKQMSLNDISTAKDIVQKLITVLSNIEDSIFN